MIVIGVDAHKQSLTAAAVDVTGRLLAEKTLSGSEDGLLAWARIWRMIASHAPTPTGRPH